MFCRLCLCQPQILIPVLDESGTESRDIVTTVERFLGLRLTIANRICVTCWASVDNFRKFCALVADRQTQFTLTKAPNESQDAEQGYQQVLTAACQAELSTNKHVAQLVSPAGAESLLEAVAEHHGELINDEEQVAYEELLQPHAMSEEEVTAATVTEEEILPASNANTDELKSKEVVDTTLMDKDTYTVLITESAGKEIAFADQPVCEKTKNEEVFSFRDKTQQKLNSSLSNSTTDLQCKVENDYVVENDKATIDALKAEKTAVTIADARPEPDLKVKSNSLQILRLANARKLGRPRRCDANASLEEDRLIASHMQLCCDICTVKIATFDALKRHFRTAHDVNGYAVCCKKRLYKRGLVIDHINVHRNPAYFSCSFCQNTFADRVCLRNHMLLKHNDVDQSPYQCVHCSRKFAKLYFLQRHMLKHVDVTQDKFSCEHCQKSYPNSSRLKSHIRNVHSDIMLKVCNYCGEIVRGSKNFQRHLMQHGDTTAVSGVQCKVCNQHLSSDYCLSIHMERHSDKREYVCAICGKDAPTRVALNAHMRYYHQANETFHECSVCRRSFKTTRGLREHMTTHTGETLYSCNYCGKRFKCSSNLHAHRKWQHAVEWTRDKKAALSNGSA